jgi:hypothetical protein
MDKPKTENRGLCIKGKCPGYGTVDFEQSADWTCEKCGATGLFGAHFCPKDHNHPLTKPEPESTFHARDREVYKRPTDEWVCRAKSNTYAIRIAAALTQYQPDRRGQ